jgi:hypothetical protein
VDNLVAAGSNGLRSPAISATEEVFGDSLKRFAQTNYQLGKPKWGNFLGNFLACQQTDGR